MAGGNNKFYVIELQEGAGQLRLYTCYGRTGKEGVKEERFPNSKIEANKELASIIKSKEKKGYKKVELATTSKGSEVGNAKILSTDIKIAPTIAQNVKSDLTPQIQALVKRLYEEAGEACQSQLSGALSTTTKNPLGTLTLSQIESGKKLLQTANDLVMGGFRETSNEILEVTNEFYSTVPQEIPLRPKDSDGRQAWLKEHCLNRPEILDEKFALLDLLSDVQGMITGFESTNIDLKYREMKCSIVQASEKDRAAAEKYVLETQSANHHWKLKVKNVYQIASGAQAANKAFMDSIGNIQPLFHGSRASNILGISKHGLLMRPPGVYITGSMFGNGIYFANQSTKSSQYATARFGGSSGKGDSYFMFIANVALGKIHKLYYSDSSLTKAPTGFDSVQGCKKDARNGGTLIHDEFMVYNTHQNQLQFLVEFTQS